MINGTEHDGITYSVKLQHDFYIAKVVHQNGSILTDKWKCQYPPRCGMDIADSLKAEEVLEELINKIRMENK